MRPAAGESAPLQQASERLHEEAWAGRVQSSSLRISQEVEIVRGCAVTVSYLPSPHFAPVPPRPGREVRSWIGRTRLGKTTRSWVWFLRGALQGEWVFSALSAAGDWVKRGSYHTAWSALPRFLRAFVLVWTRHGCRATYWGAVLATALWIVEGYRTTDEAMEC